MTVCVFAEGFESKLTPMPILKMNELEAFVNKPIEFPYMPEDYTSWSEKTDVTNEKGVVTKTTVRTFMMDDGDTLV